MEGVVAVFIPIVLFVCILLGFFIERWYRASVQRELQQTVRLAVEKGNPLSEDTLAQLMPPRDPNSDLRRGVISIVVAVATVIFANVVGEAEAVGPLTGLAAFPFLIGLAYVAFWRFNRTS